MKDAPAGRGDEWDEKMGHPHVCTAKSIGKTVVLSRALHIHA